MVVKNTVIILLLSLCFFTNESSAKKWASVDSIKLLGVKSADSYDYADYGLSGKNKPNGIIYRLRKSIAPNLPKFLKNIQADIIDYSNEGWLVLDRNRAIVHLYDMSGKMKWKLNLNDYVEENKMEVQDIRYENKTLYFNAACQSYSSGSGGLCSSLYAINPDSQKRLWKSNYLVSNNIFIIHGNVIVAGYGFTAEPDYLFILDRMTGKILNKKKLDSAHSYMEIVGNKLNVITYKKFYVFDLGKYSRTQTRQVNAVSQKNLLH